MKIHLTRNKVFIIGIIVITMFLVLNRFDFIMGSKVTVGEVVRHNYWTTNRGYSTAPIIQFYTEEYEITFQGVENSDLELREKVDVIYKVSNPTKAEVYSFVGFWLMPMIYCITPVILLISIVFSFLEPHQIIEIDLNKLFKKKEENRTPTINDN